jgi:hypothetical protein
MNNKITTLLIAFAAGILLACVSSCVHKYEAGWRSVAGVQSAGNLADDVLAKAAKAKHDDCFQKHGQGTYQYADCIDTYRRALVYWVTYVRRVINSALQATVTGLTIAENVKAKNNYDWKQDLWPAVCTLAKILEEWSPMFGKHTKKIQSYLNMAKGITCKR